MLSAADSLMWDALEIGPQWILRETEDGIQIIDGERRWRACKLLAEKYGDAWRMVPGRCHKLGAVSDEQANFIMHSRNAHRASECWQTSWWNGAKTIRR